MSNFPASLLVVLTVGSSAGLMLWQVVALQRSRCELLDRAERDFRRAQFRRRMQASAMLGLLGLALLAAPVISPERRPLAFVVYWIGVLAWLGWIVLLALGDAWFSHQHIRRQAHRELDRILHDRETLAQIQRSDRHGKDRGGE